MKKRDMNIDEYPIKTREKISFGICRHLYIVFNMQIVQCTYISEYVRIDLSLGNFSEINILRLN